MRILPLLLLLALPAAAQAQFDYTTNNGAITITKYTGPGGAVTIPDAINGLPVTTIGGAAFNNCPSLTSVTIPNSVTSIGDRAFASCPRLTVVYFRGNCPSPTTGSYVFGGRYNDGSSNVTVFYLPGTTGWGNIYGKRPARPIQLAPRPAPAR